MKNIQIEKLSDSYTIRRLTDADVPLLYAGCCAMTSTSGIAAAVRLGIDKENPQSNHFWRKNGFAVLREAAQERGIVLLTERRLA